MLKKLNRRSTSDSSNIERPTTLATNPADQPALPQNNGSKVRSRRMRISKVSGARLLSIPDMPKRVLGIPDVSNLNFSKDNGPPKEMIPVLTFLAAHAGRPYIDGYFMILNELNNDGEPIRDRKWTEVFATLQGTVITMWDAALLDQGIHEMSFINVTDGYMRSVETLGPDLRNVIVMSTTMKNRYIFQFGTKKLFNEWSAALRLATFEHTSLQEAYTGALLSSKGSQMNGIQSVLHETKHKVECWCNVRFGVGMPWKRVWAVLTPNAAIKDKKLRKQKGSIGKIEMFSESKKDKKKKKPLATIHQAYSAFAVFPEKSILVDVSTLIKMECLVEFEGDNDVRESAVFMMPEPLPHTQGYESLIRFLIPLYDIYGLYGRPKRLNADKNDLNSLLFALPSLPRIYYLDVIDIYMLASLPESQSWSAYDWNTKIKELLARKIAVGFRGTGNIRQTPDSTGNSSASSRSRRFSNNSMLPPPNSRQFSERPRAVSEPKNITLPFLATSNAQLPSTPGKELSSTPTGETYPLAHSRQAPKAPTNPSSSLNTPVGGSGPTPTSSSDPLTSTPNGSSNPNDSKILVAGTATVPSLLGPRGQPGAFHERNKSEGQTYQKGLISPELDSVGQPFGDASSPEKPFDFEADPNKRSSRITEKSVESFTSANEQIENGVRRKSIGTGEDNAQLFDPTFRPAHQSYAEYSEYMHHYLQNLSSQKGSTGQTGTSDAAAAATVPGGGLSYPPEGAPGATYDTNLSKPGEGDRKYNNTSRPSTPPTGKTRAQLLNTPIHTPSISLNNISPNEATREVSPQQSTALTAPRIAAYPNAPGSPGLGKYSPEQRRPSGPRPNPDSVKNTTTNTAKPQSAQLQQVQPQQAQLYQPQPYPQAQPAVPSGPRPYNGYSAAPLQPPSGIAGGPPRQGSPNMMFRSGSPYNNQDARFAGPPPNGSMNGMKMNGQMNGHMHGVNPNGPMNGMNSPMNGPRNGPMNGPMNGMHSPMNGSMGPPPMGSPMFRGNAGPRGSPMMQHDGGYFQGNAQVNMQGRPNGHPQYQQQFRYGGPPNANPYAPAGPPAVSPGIQALPNGNSPSGSNLSLHELRAQQLRSTRAHAMDGGPYGM